MKRFGIVLLAFLVWVAANLSFGWVFGGMSADVSNNKIYTLSEISQNAVRKITSPVYFTLYVSDNLSSYDVRSYRYANYVTAILSQYQKSNPDNIGLEIIRFASYTAESEQAENKGIKAIPYDNEYVYFGLEITSEKQTYVMSVLLPERQPYFENDINRILRDIQVVQKPIVGIMSPEIPLFGKSKRSKVWSLVEQIIQDYELVSVSDEQSYISSDIDVLLVLNPQKKSPLLNYALEQYLLSGGKMIIFLDPYSEVEHFYRGYPPHAADNLTVMLKNWGIVYNPQYVVGSLETAMQTEEGDSYPLWFMVADENYKKLSFHSAGSVDIEPVYGLNYEILLKTPDNSGRIETEKLRYSSKRKAMKHFRNEEQSYNLAVKVTGDFVSGYEDSFRNYTSHAGEMPPFLPISAEGAELIVITDSDFASNDGWVLSDDKENPIYGSVPYADNAEFLLALIDGMTPQYKNFTVSARPKYTDESNISQYITQPVVNKVRQYRNELSNNYEEAQNALKEAEYLAKDKEFDAGLGIQYRQTVDEIKKISDENKRKLDYLDNTVARRIERSLGNLLLLNLLVYPAIILSLLFAICFILRKHNLKRLK